MEELQEPYEEVVEVQVLPEHQKSRPLLRLCIVTFLLLRNEVVEEW